MLQQSLRLRQQTHSQRPARAASVFSLRPCASCASLHAGAYPFVFPRPRDGVPMRYLLPLLGSVNHAGPAQANARTKQDPSTGAFLVVAKRDIAKGTEVSVLDSGPRQCGFDTHLDGSFLAASSFSQPSAVLQLPGVQPQHWRPAASGCSSGLSAAQPS